MGYVDPSNYGNDIQGDAVYGYRLLWVVWIASGIAMLLQYLSGKLGISTGQSLSNLIHKKLNKKAYVIPY